MVGAELEPGSLSAGSSSFIVVDFFDFESQATPLLPGMSPAFDFATTFKVSKYSTPRTDQIDHDLDDLNPSLAL